MLKQGIVIAKEKARLELEEEITKISKEELFINSKDCFELYQLVSEVELQEYSLSTDKEKKKIISKWWDKQMNHKKDKKKEKKKNKKIPNNFQYDSEDSSGDDEEFIKKELLEKYNEILYKNYEYYEENKEKRHKFGWENFYPGLEKIRKEIDNNKEKLPNWISVANDQLIIVSGGK